MVILRRILGKLFWKKPKFGTEETNLMKELAKDPKFRTPSSSTGEKQKPAEKYYGEGMTKTGSGERPVERMQRELMEKRETAELRKNLIQGGMTPGQADKELKKRK